MVFPFIYNFLYFLGITQYWLVFYISCCLHTEGPVCTLGCINTVYQMRIVHTYCKWCCFGLVFFEESSCSHMSTGVVSNILITSEGYFVHV